MTFFDTLLESLSSAMMSLSVASLDEMTPFTDPTVDDVLEVRRVLAVALSLPAEIIDAIIDDAEYWPKTTARTKARKRATNSVPDVFVLRSLPIGLVQDDQPHEYPYEITPSPLQPLPDVFEDDEARTAHESLLRRWKLRAGARLERPCRKIVFTIQSRDQGWGGGPRQQGTFNGAYSWFAVGKERVEARTIGPKHVNYSESTSTRGTAGDHSSSEDIIIGTETLSSDDGERNFVYAARNLSPTIDKGPPNAKFIHHLMPDKAFLQANRVAMRQNADYTVTWSWRDCVDPESPDGLALKEMGRGPASMTGDYVRDLRVGDIVTVWARARFPGWENQVSFVQMDLYWAA